MPADTDVMTAITELLFVRDVHSAPMFRFEQHPLPPGGQHADHVARLLGTYRAGQDVEVFWLMSRKFDGLVIDSWVVTPDPLPSFPVMDVDGSARRQVPAMVGVYEAAQAAVARLVTP